MKGKVLEAASAKQNRLGFHKACPCLDLAWRPRELARTASDGSHSQAAPPPTKSRSAALGATGEHGAGSGSTAGHESCGGADDTDKPGLCRAMVEGAQPVTVNCSFVVCQ